MFSRTEKKRVNILLARDSVWSEKPSEESIVNEVFESEFFSSFKKIIIYANLSKAEQQFLVIRIFIWCLLPILLFVFSGKSLGLLIIPISLILESSHLKQKINKRVKSFEQDYSALLLSLASSIKTGADPIFTLCQADNLFPEKSIISREISVFRANIEQGIAEEKCLRRFANTILYPDLDLFRTAMIIARKEGSALGECLQRLVKVTRQRQSFSRKVNSAVAMQKMSSYGISACAVGISLIQYFANPQSIINAFNHPIGHKILITGIGLILFGIIWMRKLTSKAV